ncbi:lanC-like protein 3 isoform X2 [Schistocerca americana]|nr:lanC-like protein 3 isoform X2 [Schistocerca americana]XP_046979716.1 lanC-like protein 3 isoform X2 [Schistocerca americana]
MSRPKRYFVNNNEEWKSREFAVAPSDWLPKINERVNECLKQQPPSARDVDGGLYVSGAGVAYMLYHLSTNPHFGENKEKFCNLGLKYMKYALEYSGRKENDPQERSAFLLGNAGTYAVAAVLYRSVDTTEAENCLKKFAAAAQNCKPLNFLRCGGDELFVGRAGYLFAARWLHKQFGKNIVPEKDIHEICSAIVESGRRYSERHHSASPLMYSYYDTEYLGAGHGLSAILQSLLLWPSFLQSNPQAEQVVHRAVDWLLSLQTESGNFPCATDELGRYRRHEEDELVHWCHGAPGVAYLMAKAYLHWKDPKYLQALERCGELIWKKGLLRKGPGICHGVAGNAYVFLLLYRLNGNDRHWLWRAFSFMQFLYNEQFRREARTPDCPYSLFEGWAGTVCFMADMLCPDNAHFPFFDVFDS